MTISQIRAVPLYCQPSRLESFLDSVAALEKSIESALRMRYTRNGGIRFLRIGRLQFSFCVCSQNIKKG